MLDESYVCTNCICLPICLNRCDFDLIRLCKLISNDLVKLSLNSKGRGEKLNIYFFHLERLMLIEIYTDTLYVLDENTKPNDVAIMGISRKKYTLGKVGDLISW